MDSKTTDNYRRKIHRLGKWYQPIQFTKNLETPSKFDINSTIYGENKWRRVIRRNLPESIKGKKILELGCSSGLYSVLCAREGAEVTAVELDPRSCKQAKLTIEIFSKLDKVDYSSRIRLLQKNFMNFKWEKYDIVLALNVFYWITSPFADLDPGEIKKFSSRDTVNKLFANIRKNSKMLVVQTDENKYYARKRKGESTLLTHSRTVAKYLRKRGFKEIKVDKPVNLKGTLRTFWSIISRKRRGMAEVDIHKPWLYSRPVITAKSPG